MYARNNATPRPITVGPVVQISDGAVQTSGASVEVSKDGGSFTAGGGTLAVSNGIHSYTPTQGETDCDSLRINVYKTGCIPATAQAVFSASATFGYAGTDQSKIANPTSIVNLSGTTIKAVTDAVALPSSASIDITGSITGNLSGSVGSVTGNVGGNVAGSVGSVTGAVTVGTNSDKTGYSLSTAGIQAIWDALTSALTTAGSIGKWILDNLNTTVSSRATQTSVDAIDDFVDTEVGAIKTVTDKLDTMLELDGLVYRYTTNALEQAPSGGGGGSTDWTSDERTAIRAILGIPSSGTTPTDPTTGILDAIRDLVVVVDGVVDAIEVDTQDIQSRLPAALQDGRIVAYVGVNGDKTGYSLLVAPPTATAIADAVWADTDADDVIRSAVGLGSANLDSQLSAALVLQKLAASGATGSVQVTDNGNGTATLVFKDTNGSTTLATVTYNYTTGARTRVS